MSKYGKKIKAIPLFFIVYSTILSCGPNPNEQNNESLQSIACIKDTLHSSMIDAVYTDTSKTCSSMEDFYKNYGSNKNGYQTIAYDKINSIKNENPHISPFDYQKAINKMLSIIHYMEFKTIKTLPVDQQVKLASNLELPYGGQGELLVNNEEILDYLLTLTKSKKNERIQNLINKLSFYKDITNKDFIFSKGSLLITSDSSTIQSPNNILDSTKLKIVMFGASWCKPCKLNENYLVSVYDHLDHDKVQIINLSIDESYIKWKHYLNRSTNDFNNYLIRDDHLTNKLRTNQGIPKIFLLDKKNKIRLATTDILFLLKHLPGTCVESI